LSAWRTEQDTRERLPRRELNEEQVELIKEMKEELVGELKSIGIEPAKCLQAVEHASTVEAAVQWLDSQGLL